MHYGQHHISCFKSHFRWHLQNVLICICQTSAVRYLSLAHPFTSTDTHPVCTVTESWRKQLDCLALGELSTGSRPRFLPTWHFFFFLLLSFSCHFMLPAERSAGCFTCTHYLPLNPYYIQNTAYKREKKIRKRGAHLNIDQWICIRYTQR